MHYFINRVGHLFCTFRLSVTWLSRHESDRLLLLFKEFGSDLHSISTKIPAPQYQLLQDGRTLVAKLMNGKNCELLRKRNPYMQHVRTETLQVEEKKQIEEKLQVEGKP